MGIGDHAILAVGQEISQVARETVDLMMDEESELISVYYGEEVDEDAANQLGEELMKQYPSCDVEVYFGGQPIYYYVISVE